MTNFNATAVEREIPLATFIYLINDVIPYFSLVFPILGLIGFLGNAITFLQPELRTKPSSIYILSSSVADCLYLGTQVLPDYLRLKHSVKDMLISSNSACQVNYFLSCFLPHLSINFLLLSMIDRFACTCRLGSPLHRLNQLKTVPYLLGAAGLISVLVSIYAPIMIYKSATGCTYRDSKLYGILKTIFNGILQPIVMLTFVLFTLRNLHRSRQRVAAAQGASASRFRAQLVVMIITQVAVTSVFSLIWVIAQLCVVFNVRPIRTIEDLIFVTLFLSFTLQIYALNNVKSFYFSMLTSRLYRATFINAFNLIESCWSANTASGFILSQLRTVHWRDDDD